LSDSFRDRRTHPRYDRQFELQGAPEEGGVVARMTADNLSEGGLYCTSTVDFPEMTRLAIRLILPFTKNGSTETEPIDVEAVVVRRESFSASNGDARYKLALFFINVENGTRESLSRFLAG